ncbi:MULTISPECIES: GUN4 domain-containing protein [unclassified Microcoleus]|uniref:GUN4 domain-containing protein n=1 Tax=unclassified Microcoleus TaxID=2642155 RepID=UPI0025F6CE34|nr:MULTISPECIES: GUN4 domain-containing protein [unclassified Microcoleus]
MVKQAQFDVFLAHNSKDKPLVRGIADQLRRRGVKPWLDEEQIPPGRSFMEVIQQAVPNVNSAAIFIGVAELGNWQAMELRLLIRRCVEADISVIPVLLPGVDKIPEHLSFLQQLNWVRFNNEIDDQALNNLEWGITGRKPDPSRLPISLIDCTALNNLLAAGRWREANEETRKIIIKVAGQEKEGYLTDEKIQQLPIQDLHSIDTLWVKYSNGNFGFSVQKRIMRESKRDPKAFGQRVGWRDQNGWISASSVIYNPIHAPEGHLPWGTIKTITMDNAGLDAIVDTIRWGTKGIAKQDWQRQLIIDFVDFMNKVTGDESDKEEMKRSLEYELSHDEAWWKGQRLAELQINKLFSFLINF